MSRTLPFPPAAVRTLRLLAVVLAILAPAAWSTPAAAQDSGGSAAPAPQPIGTGEIDLKVLRYGVGNRPRPGDWAGIQVELTNRSDKIREIIVRVGVPDAEGDRGDWERSIVAPQPGAKATVWLYARLPFSSSSEVYSITAFEAEERPAGESGGARYLAGRQVGATVATMGGAMGGGRGGAGVTPVSPMAAMIGIVGPRTAGLDQYLVPIPGIDYSPTGHEKIEVIGGLRVADLPDRWLGLAPFEAIVWTAAGAEGEPRDLADLQAEAIREWVRRGGHLVVVLPSLGQGWLGRGDHLLADIMPAATVRSLEGVSLDPYRKLLTSKPDARLPQSAVVNALEPDPGAGAFDAVRVIDGPDGQAVAVRRIVGTGAVTVIGLDLASRALGAMGGIEADIMWNRILGKRLDLMTAEELDNQGIGRLGLTNRQERWFDRDIAGTIAMTGKAASGLLLAFFVFLLYWLAAGPGGYLGLRRMGWKHHAWIAFVLIAGVFTAIAWGGATLIKPRRVQAQHLTFLDHVYGQPNQRARMWTNLLLPQYGEQRVAIGDGSESGGAFHQAIASWDAPSSGVGLGSEWMTFPDSRGYSVDARSPDSVEVPARSTIRQFQMDWAGPARWKMPAPMLPEGAAPAALGSEIKLIKRTDPPPGERWWSLHGSLVHELPGALEDVVVVVVLRQGHLRVPPESALVSDVYTAQLQGPWEPGVPMDLNAVTPPVTGRVGGRQYFSDLVGNPSEYGVVQDEQSAATPGRDSLRRLTGLAFYGMLEPPRTSGPVPEQSVLARRQAAQTWDLARWFTQPCVIIVGHLVDGESPVPVLVDGEPAQTKGRTVVRWVYPLAADPPRFEPILQGD